MATENNVDIWECNDFLTGKCRHKMTCISLWYFTDRGSWLFWCNRQDVEIYLFSKIYRQKN